MFIPIFWWDDPIWRAYIFQLGLVQNHQLARVCVQKVSCHPVFYFGEFVFYWEFSSSPFCSLTGWLILWCFSSCWWITLSKDTCSRNGKSTKAVKEWSPTHLNSNSNIEWLKVADLSRNKPPQMVQYHARSKYWCFTREPGALISRANNPRHFRRYAMARPRPPRAWNLLGGRGSPDGIPTRAPWMYGYFGLDEPFAPGYLFQKKARVWMSGGIWSLIKVSLRRCYFDPELLICLQGSRKAYECVSKKG